jgi:hypothetical protein
MPQMITLGHMVITYPIAIGSTMLHKQGNRPKVKLENFIYLCTKAEKKQTNMPIYKCIIEAIGIHTPMN